MIEGANQQIQGIPFSTLIGSPLKSTVEAQALAAQSTINFINEVGFDPQTNKNTPPQIRTVTFTYQRVVEDATGKQSKANYSVTVPILTIVPIPFIRIDEFNLTFKAKVNAINTESNSDSSSKDGGIKLNLGAKYLPFLSAGISGGFSSKKDSTNTKESRYSVEYTMDINIHATQDDMPAGLARMLNILEGSIQGFPEPAPNNGGSGKK